MAGIFDMTGFLTPLVSKLVNFIPDPVAKAQAQALATTEMLTFVSNQNTAQLAVDAAEANNKNTFVAGWRPAIGWVCAAAYGYKFVIQPLLVFGLTAAGHPVVLPTLDEASMNDVLMGMLGLGGMRTFEKVQGVAPKGAQ